MRKFTFYQSNRFWPEIILLLEAVVLKWNSLSPQLLADEWKFYGNYCKCLETENSSHLYGLLMRQNLSVLSLEERDIPTPKTDDKHDNEFFQKMQQVVFGHAFERALPQIEAKWGSAKQQRGNWPGLLDFCFHIRNGVFHGNQFNITGSIYQDTLWSGARIRKKYNGEHVMGLNIGFLGLADVIALLYDLEGAIHNESVKPFNRAKIE